MTSISLSACRTFSFQPRRNTRGHYGRTRLAVQAEPLYSTNAKIWLLSTGDDAGSTCELAGQILCDGQSAGLTRSVWPNNENFQQDANGKQLIAWWPVQGDPNGIKRLRGRKPIYFNLYEDGDGIGGSRRTIVDRTIDTSDTDIPESGSLEYYNTKYTNYRCEIEWRVEFHLQHSSELIKDVLKLHY